MRALDELRVLREHLAGFVPPVAPAAAIAAHYRAPFGATPRAERAVAGAPRAARAGARCPSAARSARPLARAARPDPRRPGRTWLRSRSRGSSLRAAPPTPHLRIVRGVRALPVRPHGKRHPRPDALHPHQRPDPLPGPRKLGRAAAPLECQGWPPPRRDPFPARWRLLRSPGDAFTGDPRPLPALLALRLLSSDGAPGARAP
jgi:hypothetical protein